MSIIGTIYKSDKSCFLSPTKVRENMYFFGSPNSPEQVRWKGITLETFGLKSNVSPVLEVKENLSNEDYIFRFPNIDTYLKKPNPNKRTYSIETLQRLVREEEASRTNYRDKNVIADLIIKKELSYSEASEKSNLTVSKLRWVVHRKSKNGFNFQGIGRAKLLDSISEEKIKEEFRQNIKDVDLSKQDSKAFVKLMKIKITKECFETYKRRFPNASYDKFKNPSKRTIDRYFSKLSP